MRFDELAPHPALARALQTRGYTEATPVQSAVMAPALVGRDLLVSAQTGSGKTAAFGLALAPTLLGDAEAFGPAAMPLALVVAPTRELAQQVASELGWLYAPAGGRVVTCVGGTDPRAEVRALLLGPHIVVGTPGRLCDHLDRRRLRLEGLRAVVLDEADEMLDLGFRDELERILKDAPPGRRTLMFSATVPKEIELLAKRYQRDAARVAVNAGGQAHADIEYRAHLIAMRDREHAVVNLLRAMDDAQALVFCETRNAVTRLHAILSERGFQAVAISGELTQPERARALQSLRDKRARVLVATDVAARGLDLPDVGLVIHADLPHDAEVLQHRSGRTGRAGRKGVASVIVPTSRKMLAERIFGRARIRPNWVPVPTADAILALDDERMVKGLPELAKDVDEDELRTARKLLEVHGPELVACALVKLQREHRPAPEDMAETASLLARGPEKRRPERTFDRGGDRPGARPPPRAPHAGKPHPSHVSPKAHAPHASPKPHAPHAVGKPHAPPKPHTPAAESGSVWFTINVGRQRNADPKWLVPLLCRRGGVTKADIGVIRILQQETHVEITREVARRFGAAASRPDPKDPKIRIEPIDGAPPAR